MLNVDRGWAKKIITEETQKLLLKHYNNHKGEADEMAWT